MKLDKDILTINKKTFQTEYKSNFHHLIVDYKELYSLKIQTKDFIEDLIITVKSPDGFGTHLFHELEFFKNDDNTVQIVFVCNQPNKYWEGNYGISTLLMELIEQIKSSEDLEADSESFEIESEWKYLNVYTSIKGNFVLSEIVDKYSKIISTLIKQTESSLSGAIWKKEYEKKESLFSTEILYPLLRKMGFLDVRYTHGIKEFGKDFTFSELTKFGNFRHYGMQVKAGNMRGNVNADIDEILGQLNDAFGMPYYEISANEERRINTFIIAISGNFTDNAKEKIANKIPNNLRGSVYMIDREKIWELIERYWK